MPEFRYPCDLVTRLREHWGVFGWRGVELPALPPDEVLVPMIEICFHASFLLEEQRRTSFRVVVGDPASSRAPIVFEQPRPFDLRELRRLAPAAHGLIGVVLGATIGACRIWGIANASTGVALTVDVRGPGKVRVGHDAARWITLDGGKLAHDLDLGLDETVAEVFGAAFEHLAALLPNPADRSSFRNPFSHWTGSLLRGAAELEHGGAIFVVPEGMATGAWREEVRLKYPCRHHGLWADMLRFAEGQDGEHDARAIDEAIGQVVALTQVDGAVVVTDHFEVLGFGAEVIAAPSLDAVFVNGERRPLEDYGTRHRSAFRLVDRCPEITAFVCSQDGGVRSVRNERGSIVLRES